MDEARLPGPSGVFTRASSGLVRQVRTIDVMFYGWQAIALSFITFIILAWGAYPGASMEFATILATAAGVAIGLCYALLATVYPRSGGEYVFISRIVHPALGFAVSFSFGLWLVFYFGINGALLPLFALSPFVSALGVQSDSTALLSFSTWLTEHWGIFITGSVTILALAYLQYRGAGTYFKWQRRASYLALASFVVTIVVLLLAVAGVFDFRVEFDGLAGAGAYDRIAAGTTLPAFDFSQTLRYMLWPAFSVWFAVQAVSFSGEIKDVRRGNLLGINGAILTMGLAMLVLMILYRGAFGSEFLLASSASENYELAAPPFVIVFTAIAGGNILLTILTFVWVLSISFFVGGAALMYATRAMLAWSIDGVAPRRLGEVNEKYNSPHWAILVTTIGAEIVLALFAFTQLIGTVSGFFGLSLTFVVVALTAIIFPFIKRDVFESSPVSWTMGKLPVITVIGVLALVPVLYVVVRLFVDNTYTLNLKFANAAGIGLIVAGFIWFYAARAFRRSRGENVDRRYDEIPIE